MDQWAAGQFQGETLDIVHILNAAARGEYQAYGRLIDLEFEQFQEVMKDE